MGPGRADARALARHSSPRVTLIRSILLSVVAALAETGGAWLNWPRVREHRGLLWICAGVIALGLYGFVATRQPDANSSASSPPTAASPLHPAWHPGQRRARRVEQGKHAPSRAVG
jgi:hypothetical protein